jgi:branched-subunit amino acid aminotransferase/4-amino-4-deoxychorismate lyase
VLEAPTSSIFWAGEGGELFTPPLDEHILASITRDRVLRLCGAGERPLTREELLEQASEAFLASTTREVQSIVAVEDREFAELGPRTAEAQAALRAHIAESLR